MIEGSDLCAVEDIQLGFGTARCTRLAALVDTMDPQLVAAAFGLNNEGVMFYLADRVDDARLTANS